MEIITLFAAIVLSLVALIEVAIYLWGADKGYDISDEAIFFLQSERPDDVKCYPFFDFRFTSWFYSLTAGSIVLHRILLLVVHLFATALFASGVLAMLQTIFPFSFVRLEEIIIVYAFILIASETRFSEGIRLLYYNNLNGCLLLASTGLLLNAFYGTKHAVFTSILIIAAGYLIGLQPFVKISSFLTNLSCLFLVFTGAGTFNLSTIVYGWLYLLAGVLLGICSYFLVLHSPRAWWESFNNQLKSAKLFHWGVNCIPRHLKEIMYYSSLMIEPVKKRKTAFGVLICLLFFLPKEFNTLNAIGVGLLFLFFVLKELELKDQPFPSINSFSEPLSIKCGRLFCLSLVFFFFSTLSLLMVQKSVYLDTLINVKNISFTLYLIVLPAIGAVGTGNLIFYNFIYQYAASGAVFLLSFQMLSLRFETPLLAYILPMLTGMFMCIASTIKANFNPYRLAASLFQQLYTVKFNKGNIALKLDEYTAKLFESIKDITAINGLKAGDDVIGLFDCPGLVHLLGGVSPGHQWYYLFQDVNSSMEFNYLNLSKVPEERRAKAFIIEHGDATPFKEKMHQLNMVFPEDYYLLSSFYWPITKKQIRIWKPKNSILPSDDVYLDFITDQLLTGSEQDINDFVISVLEEVSSTKEDKCLQLVSIGNILLINSQLKKAQIAFSASIALNPIHIRSLIGFATCVIGQREVDTGRGALEKVLEIEPDNSDALKLTSFIHRIEGDPKKAEELIKRVLQNNPDDDEVKEELDEIQKMISLESGQEITSS
jgi:tetratricopeptide (TPR) repeat protein